MSGLKISRQQLNQMMREQIAEKASRETQENICKERYRIQIDCGKEAMECYARELYQIREEAEAFASYAEEMENLLAEIEGLDGNISQLRNYFLISDTPDVLKEYLSEIRRLNKEMAKKLPSFHRTLGKVQRKQEKEQEDSIEEKCKQLERIQAKEMQVLEGKEEVLSVVQEAEYLERVKEYEKAYIHEAVREAIEATGCKVIATKKQGESSEVREQLFTYENGTAIHVMEQDNQISMEIVGVDNVEREPQPEEMLLIESKMYAFEKQYSDIQQSLRRKGIVPVSGSELVLPPSRNMVKIVDVTEFDLEEGKPDITEKKLNEKKKKKANIKTL